MIFWAGKMYLNVVTIINENRIIGMKEEEGNEKTISSYYSKFTNYRHDAQLGSKSSFSAFFEGENEFLRPKMIIERRDDN